MDASRCIKVRFWILTGSAWALGIALTDSLARLLLVSSIPLLIIFGVVGLDYFIDRPQNRLWRLQKLAEDPYIAATERSKRIRVLREYEAEFQQLQIRRGSGDLPPWQCILGQRGRRIFGETRRANGKSELLATIRGAEYRTPRLASVAPLEKKDSVVSSNPNPDADSQALPSKWTEGVKESGGASNESKFQITPIGENGSNVSKSAPIGSPPNTDGAKERRLSGGGNLGTEPGRVAFEELPTSEKLLNLAIEKLGAYAELERKRLLTSSGLTVEERTKRDRWLALAKTSDRPHTESSNAVPENQTSSLDAEKAPRGNEKLEGSSGGPKKTQAEKWLEIDRKYQERDRIRKEREQAAEKLKVRMEEILRYFANSTKYLSLEDNPASLAQALWLQTRIRPTPQEFGVSDRGAELLAAQWLRYLGEEEVIVTQYSQDGGVDVLTENFACQVKNYSKMKVSLSEIRDLLGTAHSLGLKPILLTSSTSTPSGLEFATQNKIAVIRYSTEDATLSPLTPMGLALLNQGRYEP